MKKTFRFFWIIVFIIAHSLAEAQPCPLSFSGSTMVCAGFQTTLTAYGASSFTWTGSTFSAAVYSSSIVVGPGTYTVTGNTSTCSLIITVLQQAPLTIQISQSSATTCLASNSPIYSKPVNLTAQGAAVYTWFSSIVQPNFPAFGPILTARPPASCCYTVVGATSICTGSTVTCISVIPQFTIAVAPTQATLCAGESIELRIKQIGQFAVGPASAFLYNWVEMGLSLNNYFTPTVIASPLSGTNYTVNMFDALGCISAPETISLTVNVCSTISENEIDKPSIFPNPFGSNLQIKSTDVLFIEVSDVLGKLVMLHKPEGETMSVLNTTLLLPGIYFVSVTQKLHQKVCMKVIKN